MGTMPAEDRIMRIVSDTVRDQLAPYPVDVRMSRGTDEDGDAVLNITVIMENEAAPDIGKMLGLAGHIRSHLDEAEGFPMLSFVSKRDAAKMGFEAA